ncbi:hypothetical protein [Bacillus sp. FJAT-45350]|uniref:hypothetical protein n=1 Tax=Bacillus sp. FJAT-45350 TaxID=2011014 RepID=UPI000BB81532|nr:hypothetical protein [Bacillus sp. FJAT-45350]
MDNVKDDKTALEKVENIKAGYSSYAESSEVINKIRLLLEQDKVEFTEDKIEVGSWFIPVNKKG